MDWDIRISALQALRFGLIDGIFKPEKIKKKKSSAKIKEYLITDINMNCIEKIIGFLDSLRDDNFPPLHITLRPGLINSGVIINLYESLKGYPAQLSITATGDMGLHAPLLLLAADERKTYLNVKFRFSEASILMAYKDMVNPRAEKLCLEILKDMNSFILTEILKHCKISKKQYQELTKPDESSWFDAKTAKKFGLIDEIIIPKHFR